MRAGGGRIINFGSGAGLKAYPNGGHYSASKGAVMAWTRTIAHEWGPFGITANSVVPAIRTEMADEAYARMDPAAQQALDARHRAQIPLGGRLGDPDSDLAPVMVFLASDGARFITGQILPVNGGSLNSR
jgi:NAD(P)-dependent dehydrogenase (short-subunit alcohol dehydrogenase family)